MKIDMANLNGVKPLRPAAPTEQEQLQGARDVQDAFRKFVGEAFFSQMLKSMRSTQHKPAYFHGGHAEQVFQSQLDQVLSEELTTSSADKLADPMFRQQFPRQAELLEKSRQASLEDLTSLRRL